MSRRSWRSWSRTSRGKVSCSRMPPVHGMHPAGLLALLLSDPSRDHEHLVSPLLPLVNVKVCGLVGQALHVRTPPRRQDPGIVAIFRSSNPAESLLTETSRVIHDLQDGRFLGGRGGRHGGRSSGGPCGTSSSLVGSTLAGGPGSRFPGPGHRSSGRSGGRAIGRPGGRLGDTVDIRLVGRTGGRLVGLHGHGRCRLSVVIRLVRKDTREVIFRTHCRGRISCCRGTNTRRFGGTCLDVVRQEGHRRLYPLLPDSQLLRPRSRRQLLDLAQLGPHGLHPQLQLSYCGVSHQVSLLLDDSVLHICLPELLQAFVVEARMGAEPLGHLLFLRIGVDDPLDPLGCRSR